MEKEVSAVEWFYDKIKSHFEHDGDLLETITFTYAIAKEKEKDQSELICVNVIEIMLDNLENGQEFNSNEIFEKVYKETFKSE